jgi:hypothetical protein
MSRSAASASDTSQTGPNTWFIARNAAAMPEADCRKARRLNPWRFA